MRHRDRILASLEKVYREAFEAAQARGDAPAADRLDFEFQRDQLRLEVLLDLRDLLTEGSGAGAGSGSSDEPASSGTGVADLLDKAQAIRRFTRLR